MHASKIHDEWDFLLRGRDRGKQDKLTTATEKSEDVWAGCTCPPITIRNSGSSYLLQ
jgi:hypothetical protein